MANFPTSVSTDANLYVAVNGLQTTLAASITNSDTTIQLTSTTGFPTTGLVTIENNEVVSYTGISGPNLTGCTRGADGTTALSHNLGVTVGATIVAAHHNLLKNEIIAIETALGAGYLQASANTANAVVQRDGSGNFSAGTITASLTGAASSNVLKSGDTMTGDLTMANQKGIILKEQTGNGTDSVKVEAPDDVTTSYTIKLPPAVASAGQVLTDAAGNGVLSWATFTAGMTQLTGDVTAGPGSGSQAATVASVGGQSAGKVASASQNIPNIITNGGFEIWQRGSSFSNPVGDTYQADRWLLSIGGGAPTTYTVSREASVIHSGTYAHKLLITDKGAATTLCAAQRVDDKDFYAGLTVSVSAWVWSNVAGPALAITDGTNQYTSSAHPGDSTYHQLTATGTLATSISSLNVYIGWIGSLGGATAQNSTVYVDDVMMVKGSTPMDFFPLHRSIELAQCRRYYEKSYDENTDPGTGTGFANGIVFVAGSTYGATSVRYNTVLFSAIKRATPTIKLWDSNGVAGHIETISSSNTFTSRAVTPGIISQNGFLLNQTASADTMADLQWTAEAEL